VSQHAPQARVLDAEGFGRLADGHLARQQ
jgi:hypothetical protein